MSGRLDDDLSLLVERALGGDSSAERDLLQVLQSPLRRFLGRLLSSAGDVEDVLQESLLALIAALPSFRRDSSVLSFSTGIALHIGLNHRRSARRRRAHALNVARLESPLAPEVIGPLANAIARRRSAALASLVGGLPPAQSNALVLLGLGHSLAEIAALTKVPRNTVRTRLRLACAASRHRIVTVPDGELLELLGEAG